MALPDDPRRRWAVIGLRVAALACAWAALQGWALTRRASLPRHIVYLVDQSDSIDAAQTAWVARRIASLEAMRPAEVSRSVWTFGTQVQPVIERARQPLTDPQALVQQLRAAPIDHRATNIEAALLAMHPATRVVMFSDGRQTMGDAMTSLGALRRLGVELFPVVVPPSEPVGFTWEALTAPSVVPQGGAVPLSLAMRNATSQARRVDVTVRVGDVVLARRRYRLAPGWPHVLPAPPTVEARETGSPAGYQQGVGWQVLSISVPALETGSLGLDVEVSTGPKDEQAEHRTVYVQVEGRPRLLWVMDTPSILPLAATALQHRGIDVAVAMPHELPTAVGGWLDYDGVVLFQVAKSALTPPQVEVLEQYISRFGGGLVMVGIGGQLDDELKHEAPLDRLLPVTFEPKGAQESKRRVCIVLLIDRSNSMMGPRIAATKRAAVELVKQLQPEDLVGVLTFDVQPYVVLDVQQAGQAKQTVVERLVKLKAGGGTDIFPALLAGYERLQASGATVKHLVLLSDGNTNVNVKAYRALLEQFKDQQVSLSTMGIGGVMVNTELLQWMALSTGGTFYQLTDINELPQLMARDTQQVLGRLPFTEGYFKPMRAPQAEWLGEIESFPPMKGFFTTTAKPSAQVELEFPQPEIPSVPLLARWPIGLGRVAVFASDADTRWSGSWLQWEQFENVWAQLMRGIMRRSRLEQLFVWVEEEPAPAQVMLAGQLHQPSAELVMPARPASSELAGGPSGQTLPLALAPLGGGRWKASLAGVSSGWYQLTVRDAAEQEGSTFASHWIQVGHPRADVTEQPGLWPDEAFLRHLAQATGGAIDLPDAAFVPPTTWQTRSVPLRGWLLPIVLVLLLIEVAIRGKTML